LMHWLLFIHKILFSSTCFEPQVLIFRRIQLYTCNLWYCHSLWEFLVAFRYIVRTDCRGKVVGGCLKTGNILHTVHTACHPTLQHRNSYNRTYNYRQWNAVGSPHNGHKDARNMLRHYWLPINPYLLHLVGLSFTYLSKMHAHSNIKF